MNYDLSVWREIAHVERNFFFENNIKTKHVWWIRKDDKKSSPLTLCFDVSWTYKEHQTKVILWNFEVLRISGSANLITLNAVFLM